MAGRKIIWSPLAERKLIRIFEYFNERNHSKTYSLKLYKTFQKELSLLDKNPELGISTDDDKIRGLITNNYTLFYEVTASTIFVHSIWDNRQDPDKLIIR